MAVKAGDLEHDLIESLGQTVGRQLADAPPESYQEFVRQYYHWVPAKDLADRDQADLCGAVVAHWRTARRRARGEAKVNVYNPQRERDGWTSPYTVVEIVSDDMPFIVDSVTMELSRQGCNIELIVHPVMRVVRDQEGELTQVLEPGGVAFGFVTESVIHAEVAYEPDPERLSVLRAGVELVLEEVRAAVEDWAEMRAKTTALATELRRQAPPAGPHELEETQAFLSWLADENFTFLGYREYVLSPGEESAELSVVEGSGLGILRGASRTPSKTLAGKALALARSPHPLVLTKANSRATVHRPSYLDYVGVKQFAPDGTVLGERRFLGLYTTTAYKTSPRDIPLLRDKVERVLSHAAFPSDSHDAKGLIDILESLPRDLLVQIDADDLFEIAIGILGLGERQRVRLFVTADQLDRFVACTLCLPRDRFNTENRQRAGRILADAFSGDHVDWRLQLSESLIVRVDYVVRTPGGVPDTYDVAEIEARIAESTRAWTDQLRAVLVAAHGEQGGGELFARYGQAFPPGYRADRSAETALLDIDRIEELIEAGHPIIDIYRRPAESENMIRCQLLSAKRVSLSDVVPTFEHMGAKVVDERPYEVSPSGTSPVWIYDFGLTLRPEGPGPRRHVVRRRDHRRLVGLAGGRPAQRPGHGRRADRPGDHDHPLCPALPAPGDGVLLGCVHDRDAPAPSHHRGGARAAVRGALRSRERGPGAQRGAHRGDRGRDRRGPEPRRGPDPAQLPRRGAGDAAHQLLPGRPGHPPTRPAHAARLPVVQAGSVPAGHAPAAPPAL